MADYTAIASATSSMAGLAGASIQAADSRKARRWQEEMMKKQNAYNLEMWRMNNEYNSPLAQKQRLLDADINPYLSNIQNTASSAPVSASPAQTTVPNTGTLISQGLQSAADTFLRGVQVQNEVNKGNADIANTNADTDTKNYYLGRQKKVDSVTKDGKDVVQAEGEERIANASAAAGNANIIALREVREKLDTEFASAPAFDSDGQPITDEQGNQLTNSQAGLKFDLGSKQKNFEKLIQDIARGNVQLDIDKIDKLLKQYDLYYTKPAELSVLRKQLEKMSSEIALNYEQASVSSLNGSLLSLALEDKAMDVVKRRLGFKNEVDFYNQGMKLDNARKSIDTKRADLEFQRDYYHGLVDFDKPYNRDKLSPWLRGLDGFNRLSKHFPKLPWTAFGLLLK